MHAWFRSLLFILSASGFSVARAQDAAPTTLEELSLEAAEVGRGFERMRRAYERTERGELEKHGSGLDRDAGSPWPPADPPLEVETWLSAMGAAPEVSTATLLEGLTEVDLDLWTSFSLADTYDDRTNTRELISEALAERGLTHSPTAELRLEVALRRVTYELSTGGASAEPTGERSNVLRIDVSLEVPARVLRSDGPHHGRLQLGRGTVQWIGSTEPSSEILRTRLGRALDALLADAASAPPQAASATAQAATSESPWAAWCSGGEAAERLEQFTASHRANRDDLDSAIDLVFGLSSVDAKATGYDEAPEYFRFLHDTSAQQAWELHYRASGRSIRTQNAPVLQHRVLLNGYETDGRARVTWSGSTALLERDALAWLGGRWVLLEGATFVDTAPTGLLLGSDMPGTFKSGYPECWSRFDGWLGTPGPENMELHSDAPAIVAFLERRERVEVPEHVALQLANRIAFAIEGSAIPRSYVEGWRTNYDGQDVFKLDSFGAARSAELVPSHVQDEVSAVIDAIEWADPIAVFAFEQPFNYSAAYHRVDLPEAFVTRLHRARPSGAGALARERLISGGDLAFDLIRFYAPSEQGSSLRDAIRTSEANRALNEIQVLEATYLPKAGEGNWFRVKQYFWYLEEPEGWDELRAKLPQELPFKRVAAAREGAPDRLEEAERLVQQAMEAAGD